MDSKFNFKNLISKNDESEKINDPIFQKAALLNEFDLIKDFETFSIEQIQLLTSKSRLKNNGFYSLSNNYNEIVIANSDDIEEHIVDHKIKSEFSKIFLLASKGKISNYESFNDEQLYYLIKISSRFPDNINKSEIRLILKKRQYLLQFVKITENFAGRESELKQLSDYVDWLPKEGLKNKFIGFIRNAISWHSKPPLLIKGIGGIGKSTLVSKFILEQNDSKRKKILPFIYFDFDLPGFSIQEPLTILLEGLRQLSIQFPLQEKLFNEVNIAISNLIRRDSNTTSEVKSNSHTREFVYNTLEDVIKKYGYDLEQITFPILAVFDSFEEMQYRATRSEISSFFSFIAEISKHIPRFRAVFAGRAEISASVSDVKFEEIELKEFDKPSAKVFLKKNGISDLKVIDIIYRNFGGNPLLLSLAIDLINRNKDSIKDFYKIKDKKHEYLVNRILEHIHDEEVRQIAVPGMLIRSISPEIIKDVLAESCGLDINNIDPNRIFKELSKEVALISKNNEDGEIVFRQDLRVACEKMILDKHPESSKRIKTRAMEYFKLHSSRSSRDKAEFYYHTFKSGKIPSDLDNVNIDKARESFNEVRDYLKASVIEFPSKSQLFINSLIGSNVSESLVSKSKQDDWEDYYLEQIKSALNGEFEFLRKIYDEVNQRRSSSHINSQFSIFDVLLCQRMGKMDLAIKRSKEARKGSNDSLIKGELQFLEIISLEYKNEFKDAFNLCLENIKLLNSVSVQQIHLKNYYVFQRLFSRLSFDRYESSILNNSYSDVHWDYVRSNIPRLLSLKDFEINYNLFSINIENFLQLEAICREHLGDYINNFALTGDLEVVKRDIFHVLECKGLISVVIKGLSE